MASDSIVTVKRIVLLKGGKAELTVTGGKNVTVDKKTAKRLSPGQRVIMRDNKKIVT